MDYTRLNYYDTNPHLRFLMDRYASDAHDILDTVGQLSAETLAKTSAANDKTGCILNKETGEVILPEGTKESLKQLRELGLIGATLPEKYGGAGLSQVVSGAISMMTSQADASLFTIPGLTEGVAEVLYHFTPENTKQEYIPKLCSTDPNNCYTGAMLLTEAGAGSDVGAARMSAEKHDDHYLLSGEKIFITNPGADVMVALARTKDAPQGTKGLSLFLVPKAINKDTVRVEKLEEKMGIHASPTGTLVFENATGYLIGRENEGFPEMLYLMNRSRLGVGGQGVGIAERAFLEAINYASTRVQFGRPITELPLMQERFVRMRTEIDAATSTLFSAYAHLEKAFAGDEKSKKLVRILTPLAKYRGSELAVWATSEAVSAFGGYGFIEEYPAARLYRDAKITVLYEGTSNIQALDVLRSMKEGTLDAIVGEITKNLAVTDPRLQEQAGIVQKKLQKGGAMLAQVFRDPILAQRKAPVIAETLIHLYEASLLLEEAQAQLDQGHDRGLALASAYISDHFGDDMGVGDYAKIVHYA